MATSLAPGERDVALQRRIDQRRDRQLRVLAARVRARYQRDAETARHEPADQLALVALEYDVGLEPGCMSGADQQLAQPRALAVGDEPLAGEFAHPHAATSAEAVVARHDRDQLLGQERMEAD